MRTVNRESGFSLIELLISVTIGLLLLLGVTQVYQGYKQSYNQQEGMAELQETARFAMQFLTRNVRQAGFRRYPYPDDEDENGLTSDEVFFVDAGRGIDTRAVAGTDGTGPNGSDTITVRFMGSTDGTILDCHGNPVDATTQTRIASNTFQLSANGELQCLREWDDDPFGKDSTDAPLRYKSDTNNDSDTTGLQDADGPQLSQNQPLLSGVTDMQILYGIDTVPADTLMRVNRYMDASAVTDWSAVVSVQITLTVQSIDQLLQSDGTTAPLERTIRTVINLRNRLS